MQKLMGWDDTIVALATPPGIGAIGVIRLSGSKTFAIANELFPSKDLLLQSSHTLHVGNLQYNGQVIDEVVLSLFKGPRSYTGEDVIEISCHGSPYIHQQIIDACVTAGARLAKPGEFTQRAFLHGKMDLAQAEAVADVIASNTQASHRTALHTMRGGFSTQLKELREQLLKFASLIELELDFSQEDVEFADRTAFYELIRVLTQSTGQLIESFRLGNVIRNGVSVAIIGKPNAGKSTLLNTLLNENRAIVSDIPGTTRDTIEEVINIGGILFRLIDTAGIRHHTHDVIEAAGVERSLEKMEQAGLVILLFDAKEEREETNRWKKQLDDKQLNYLLVINKIDEAGEANTRIKFDGLAHLIFISAREGNGIDLLKEQMIDAVVSGDLKEEDTIITNARHYQALKETEKSLLDIKKGLDDKLPGDLLALDIRRCLHYLGEITGEVNNEEMLGYIFGKFCIGK
jgi:tRNA modification GTPase